MQTRRSLDNFGEDLQNHGEDFASSRVIARFSSRNWHRKSMALGISALLTLGLSGCAGLPHLEHSDTSATADACTSSLLKAQAFDKDSAQTNVLGIAGRAVAAKSAAAAWITVADHCSTRFSEAIVKAGAAQHRLVLLADHAGWNELLTGTPINGGISANSDLSTLSEAEITTAISSISDVDASVLRAMSVAHDKAAYAFEVLAARESPINTGFEQLSLGHRRAATALAESAMDCSTQAQQTEDCSSTDPRKKVYSIEELMKGNTSITDASSGLQTSTVASLEMDCALEELKAATDADSDVHNKTALASFISSDIAAAYAQGYPTAPLPLTSQAS